MGRFARRFDQVELSPAEFRVSEGELEGAAGGVARRTRAAIDLALANITAFARKRLPQDWTFSPRPGVVLGERFVPLSRIAAYIPGGAAPLVSTVLHTLGLARAAGVPELVLATPPGPDKQVNPAILYAAQTVGVTEVYRLGGAYAIGALAYGTATVPKVEKIVGPGNAYVTAAKRQVYGHVALDLVAGPSEVLIIADDSARAEFVAADMLAQAEHGSGAEQAVLVTTSDRLLEETAKELERQAAAGERQDCIRMVLGRGVFLIRAADLEQAAAIANDYAPEHLEIMTADPQAVAAGISCAGAVFLGEWTPEPVGDYVAGPSHVLPTGGAARCFSGLTIEQFFRRISQVQYDREALAREADALAEFAKVEELDAHGRAVSIRFNDSYG